MPKKLSDGVIAQLEEWSGNSWPKNVYVYAKEGEVYVRWTPSCRVGVLSGEERFTLANITVYEEFRGKGIFKDILRRCCESSVPVIRIECIQNPRLVAFLRKYQFPGRKTLVFGSDIAPSVDLARGP